MNYRKSIPVLDVVLSGFYDSAGLYRTPSKEEIQAARKWLEAMGFLERENEKLKHFSFGEQRLILLARALVKNPRLLVLDEPLQGLDPENRKLFLQVIEQYGLSDTGAVLYITHHTEEIGSYFTHMMKLDRSRNSFHFEIFQLKPKNPQ
jgi:molybdate transport system ATP-binding protein